MKYYLRFIPLLVFLFLADQIFKFSLLENSACNKNIAWSIPIAPAIFYFVWIVIIVALFRLFLEKSNAFRQLYLVFILAGAFSNMADRLRLGCVVDYIDLKIFPAFNLADAYITIGVVALITIKILNPKH